MAKSWNPEIPSGEPAAAGWDPHLREVLGLPSTPRAVQNMTSGAE